MYSVFLILALSFCVYGGGDPGQWSNPLQASYDFEYSMNDGSGHHLDGKTTSRSGTAKPIFAPGYEGRGLELQSYNAAYASTMSLDSIQQVRYFVELYSFTKEFTLEFWVKFRHDSLLPYPTQIGWLYSWDTTYHYDSISRKILDLRENNAFFIEVITKSTGINTHANVIRARLKYTKGDWSSKSSDFLMSRSIVADMWYHVALERIENKLYLIVNEEFVDSSSLDPDFIFKGDFFQRQWFGGNLHTWAPGEMFEMHSCRCTIDKFRIYSNARYPRQKPTKANTFRIYTVAPEEKATSYYSLQGRVIQELESNISLSKFGRRILRLP